MSPGDEFTAHNQPWTLLQLLYISDGKQYCLAVEVDCTYPCQPKIVFFEVE